ncbi:MAG: heat-inducible transcriptional repressor HrcA [Candidatus Muirbacterium halophilum]|nr:heat-inducible transcriptional repressor HrcA [Candidatus Muirbacterium halophilum]MCK9474675.1 heat-inducible transcriptional repressor HrcA [Candidatus Muirbacterium halophilum]
MKRKELILKNLIKEFIKTGNPVSSLDIKKIYTMNCSSATIRNEMACLEDNGLLIRFHNFGGRIPSDLGYRYYVDNLLDMTSLNKEDEMSINSLEEIGKLKRVKEIILRELFHYSAGLLSNLSGHAGFLIEGRNNDNIIKNLNIIKVNENVFTVFFQFEDNVIKNKIWFSIQKLSHSDIEKINNIFSHIIRVRQSAENMVSQFFSKNLELNYLKEFVYDILNLVLNSDIESNIDKSLYIEGIKQLITKPEFADIEKIKSLIELFENRTLLIKEIKSLIKQESINVVIGEEFDCSELIDFSFVTIPYSVEGINKGVVGVIGSKRMEYQKVINIVKKTAENISHILTSMKIKKC